MEKSLARPLFFCLLALAAPALAGFAPADSAKALAHCQGGSFIEAPSKVSGKNQSEARGNAKTEMARNIISQVESEISISGSSEERDGVLKESSKFGEKNRIKSSLTLVGFQEMEAPKRLENGDYEIKGYICVKDAAAPNLNSIKDLARALKSKKAGRDPCKGVKETYDKIYGLENVLGYFARLSGEVQAEYETLKKEYQKAKVFWQDDGNECSEAAFAILSKKIKMEKMEKSRCSNGFNLRFKCPEKCQSFSYNIECSSNPSLSIESCGGEKHSMLKAKEPVTGSDAYNKNMARENMIENLSNADFFKEWEKEIIERIPQCAE